MTNCTLRVNSPEEIHVWSPKGGISCTVQHSTNMENWTDVPVGETNTWTDIGVSEMTKYYRVFEQ